MIDKLVTSISLSSLELQIWIQESLLKIDQSVKHLDQSFKQKDIEHISVRIRKDLMEKILAMAVDHLNPITSPTILLDVNDQS